jgi:hypothetical protein
MLIVMNMENGKIIRDPVVTETDPCMAPPAAYIPQTLPIPQPRLQEISLPPRAACPPPSLGVINVSLSAFDA